MNLQNFHDTLQSTGPVDCMADLQGWAEALCAQLGFQYFIFVVTIPTSLSRSSISFLGNYPNAWIKLYFKNRYQDYDPVIRHCLNSHTPVAWHKLDALSQEEQGLMQAACQHGLNNGLTVPIHGAHGELALLSLATNDASTPMQEHIEHSAPFAQMFCQRLYDIASTLRQRITPLSPRETECLRLAADGLTSAEIAQALQLTARTINFHLNNAIRKLGASSRQEAVALALVKRLILRNFF